MKLWYAWYGNWNREFLLAGRTGGKLLITGDKEKQDIGIWYANGY
jgi:hypothetical protein